MFYGRYFNDENSLYDISWWLCLTTFDIYDTETLIANYSYKSIAEIKETAKFIPFFKTDIIRLEKEFIKEINNKTLLNSFNKLLFANNCNYNIAFRMFIEREFLVDSWSEYEKAQLKEDAIIWCKENHIAYTIE